MHRTKKMFPAALREVQKRSGQNNEAARRIPPDVFLSLLEEKAMQDGKDRKMHEKYVLHSREGDVESAEKVFLLPQNSKTRVHPMKLKGVLVQGR